MYNFCKSIQVKSRLILIRGQPKKIISFSIWIDSASVQFTGMGSMARVDFVHNNGAFYYFHLFFCLRIIHFEFANFSITYHVPGLIA